MDFKQLQTYVTVIERQSFTNAAKQLFVSQPTVSAHIRALEEELGTSLIERTTKSILVTPKGQAVYEHALSILHIRDQMIRACKQEEKRIIRVAASTIPASYMLPQIFSEYGRICSQTYFSIRQGRNKDVLDGVESGLFDLGFSTQEGGGELVSMPLCRDRMVLITPVTPHFLELQTKEYVPIRQLIQYPIILREKAESGEKLADRNLAALGVCEDDLHVVQRANDQEQVKNMVAGGMGVSLISRRAAQNFIEEKRVLCFELPVSSEKTIYLVCRKQEWEREHIRNFASFVQKICE